MIDLGEIRTNPVYTRIIANAMDAMQAQQSYQFLMTGSPEVVDFDLIGSGYDDFELWEYMATVRINADPNMFVYNEHTSDDDPDVVSFELKTERIDHGVPEPPPKFQGRQERGGFTLLKVIGLAHGGLDVTGDEVNREIVEDILADKKNLLTMTGISPALDEKIEKILKGN